MDNSNSDNKESSAIINADNRLEVESLHQQWKQFTHEEIVEAVKKYGPEKKNIERYLSSHGTEE